MVILRPSRLRINQKIADTILRVMFVRGFTSIERVYIRCYFHSKSSLLNQNALSEWLKSKPDKHLLFFQSAIFDAANGEFHITKCNAFYLATMLQLLLISVFHPDCDHLNCQSMQRWQCSGMPNTIPNRKAAYFWRRWPKAKERDEKTFCFIRIWSREFLFSFKNKSVPPEPIYVESDDMTAHCLAVAAGVVSAPVAVVAARWDLLWMSFWNVNTKSLKPKWRKNGFVSFDLKRNTM